MKSEGQTLIEVLVALSAILIVLSAITSIVISSLDQASVAKNTSVASQLAQEGIEEMKLLELPSDGEYCMGDDKSLSSGPCNEFNTLGQYIRSVTISTGDCTPLKEVSVKVSWTDSRCGSTPFCHVSPLTTCMRL